MHESRGLGDVYKRQTLNIPNFIFNNLIPVTIGNIVGGMAFFGIPLMYINGVGGKKA